MSETDCTPQGIDPSGVPFSQLDPALLREQRTSIKWARFPADVLPLFVAEMDFAVAPAIRRALIERVEASDIGYVNSGVPLAEAFAGFARDRWGWEVPTEHVHLATDVATGVVEALRVHVASLAQQRRDPGRLVIPTPTYPGFFEMLQELPFEVVQVPLADRELDLEAIEREFARGADAFILCNPHNPHGIAFTQEELIRLAELAAEHDVFVVSDEIHAPLTHRGVSFTPFAPIAAEAGALAVTATSASKGWNLAGAKASVIVAADDRANALLRTLPPEVLTRTSILGLHASIAAFSEARDWLDRAIAQVEANAELLGELVRSRLPGVKLTRPDTGYLAWLDFREAGLGDDPYRRIVREAKVALNNGHHFGEGGQGHARLNLACAPDTIREAVDRIAAILPDPAPASLPPASSAPTQTPTFIERAETGASGSSKPHNLPTRRTHDGRSQRR